MEKGIKEPVFETPTKRLYAWSGPSRVFENVEGTIVTVDMGVLVRYRGEFCSMVVEEILEFDALFIAKVIGFPGKVKHEGLSSGDRVKFRKEQIVVLDVKDRHERE